MSYLVLARKYRPQTFADLAGQDHVVQTLVNAIASGRVAHAFLFTGARGVGKTTAARVLAKALNCETGPTATPCGTCRACTEITAGQSVDVLEIDGASNNGVDQVRDLRDGARYLPSRDRFKIYIIDEVHMLSGAAFNALLKTLEEPPPHVKFIFATTEPHKIPVTILSRTQRFDFRRIPLQTIVTQLTGILKAEGIGLSERAVALVARQAEGSMRDALSLLDQVISAGGERIDDETAEEILGVIDRTVVARLGAALVDGDAAEALSVVARVFDRGLDLGRLAEDLAWHLRNLMVVQVGGRALEVLDVADHERGELEAQAGRASAATLSYLFDVVHGAIPEVSRAVQPRLALEVALLKAIHLAPGADVAELLARVEALASGGPLPGTGSGGRGRPSRAPARRAAPPAPAATRPAAAAAPPAATPAAQPSPAAPSPAAPSAAAPSPAAPSPAAPSPAAPSPAAPSPAAPSPAAPRSPRAGPGDVFASFAARMMDGAPSDASEAPADGPPGPEPPPPMAERDTGSSPATGPEAAGPRAEAKATPGPAPAKAAPAPPAAPKPAAARPAAPKAPAPAKAKAGAGASKAGGPARPGEARTEVPRLPAGDDPAANLATRFAALVTAIYEHAVRPFIAAALEHGRPLEIADDHLTVALPPGLYHDGLGSAANRRVLESLVSDHFGRELAVRLERTDTAKLDGAPEAIATVKEQALAAEVERLRAEALENPSVRLALEALDGEIEDIRILGA